MPDMLQHLTFHSFNPGFHLVVLGAVHGNETCGTVATRRIVRDMEAGNIVLQKGKASFVPICNPQAYRLGTRFVERNLNRYFYPKPHATHYEDRIDPILCALLDEADALLDLHSYQSEGDAFCFLGTTSQAEIDYARALAAPSYIYGWADAFSKDATEEQKRASIGTTDYVRQNRKRGMAVTLECGNHQDPLAPQRGYDGILRALEHLGMIIPTLPPIDWQQQTFVKMTDVFYKEKEGRMLKPWRHMDRVNAGEIIARYQDGTDIVASYDAVIVLPKTATDFAIGAEWFYLGVETEAPAPSVR